jgi:hypothetical protein
LDCELGLSFVRYWFSLLSYPLTQAIVLHKTDKANLLSEKNESVETGILTGISASRRALGEKLRLGLLHGFKKKGFVVGDDLIQVGVAVAAGDL